MRLYVNKIMLDRDTIAKYVDTLFTLFVDIIDLVMIYLRGQKTVSY